MINVVTKSGNLAPYLKASSQVVANGLKPAAAAAIVHKDTVVQQPGIPTSSHTLNKALVNGPFRVVSGPTGRHS